ATAFRLLVAHGANPGEAAEHAILGQLVGDGEAIMVLQRAGRQALAAGALATAHEHLEAAQSLAGREAPPALLMSLAETLLSTGEPGRAVDVYARIVDGGEAPIQV